MNSFHGLVIKEGNNITWQWSIGKYTENAVDKKITTAFKEIGTEANLEYKTTELGHYFLRLVTSNKYHLHSCKQTDSVGTRAVILVQLPPVSMFS